MYIVRGGVTHSCELEPIHLVQILFPCPNFTPILNLECLYNSEMLYTPLAQRNQFVGLFMLTSKIFPNRALSNAAVIIVQIHSNRAISTKMVVFLL